MGFEWDLKSVCALCISYEYKMKSLLKGQEPQEVKKMFPMKERKYWMNALWNDS